MRSFSRLSAAGNTPSCHQCPVEWDAGLNEIALPVDALEHPLPGADPDLVRYAEALLEQQRSESLEAPS